MKNLALVLSISLLIQTINSELIFTNVNSTISWPVYQGIWWDQDINLNLEIGKKVHILPLNEPRGDFNPCDESTFKQENIENYLNYIGLEANLTNVIGYVESPKIFDICKFDPQLINWEYYAYIAYNVQKLGLKSVIMHTTKQYTIHKFILPNMDVNKRTIRGVEITTSAFMSPMPLSEELTAGVDIAFTLEKAAYNSNPFDCKLKRFAII